VDLREKIDVTNMGGYQWLIIGMCTLLNALDGYDVLAISFASNQVSDEFQLTGTALGIVMSAALVGMAIGALVLGPVADMIGRRNMTILALVVNIAGLLLSATAASAFQLGLWRVVTGLGIGGILVGTNVISAEYASRKRRGLAISIYAAGYGIGASLGGTIMVGLIGVYGWRSVFVAGGMAATIALILVLFLLPESASFLYQRRPNGAQHRIDTIGQRLGYSEHFDLDAVDPPGGDKAKASVAQLFNADNRRITTVVWTAFFVIMFAFYFVSSWTPRLMSASGLSENLSMFVTVSLTLGGAIGSVVFGLFTSRWSTRSVLMSFTVLAAVLMVSFIFTAQVLFLVSSGLACRPIYQWLYRRIVRFDSAVLLGCNAFYWGGLGYWIWSDRCHYRADCYRCTARRRMVTASNLRVDRCGYPHRHRRFVWYARSGR